MTDGPFRYTELSGRWKEYGRLLDEDVFTPADRLDQARKALIEDLAPGAFRAMLREVQSKLDHLQGYLFIDMAKDALEKIVDKYPACPQSENFRREMLAEMSPGGVSAAFDTGLQNTFQSGIDQANEHLRVHCIVVDEKREKKDKQSNLRANHDEVFSGMTTDFLHQVIFDRTASLAVSAGSRSEDGPPL